MPSFAMLTLFLAALVADAARIPANGTNGTNGTANGTRKLALIANGTNGTNGTANGTRKLALIANGTNGTANGTWKLALIANGTNGTANGTQKLALIANGTNGTANGTRKLALIADGARNASANGTRELDVVEAALHKILDAPKLSPAELGMAKKVVADVDSIVAQIQGAKNLTKQAKMQKVGQALQELKDLQGELELGAVQLALHKMEQGNMTSEVAKSAKEVAERVDKVAEALENGKNMTKEQKNQMVAGAIQKLQGLQGLFEKSLKAAANHSASEKLETLEKELGLKKQELQELVNKKASAKAGTLADEKEKKEQEELVAALVGKAEELKTAKGVAAKKSPEAKLPAPIQAIVTTLQSKVLVATAELAKMDAEEVAREHKADEAAKEASQGKDAKKAQRLSSMLKFLAKEEQHTFTKLRAAKEHNLHELQQAVRGVESGDVAAVQKVMAEMQHDVKSFEVKSHNFLY
jgi:hypothetical protein